MLHDMAESASVEQGASLAREKCSLTVLFA
jgi:hypothetical protein